MALAQYAIINSDGTPGGTQICEGRSCYPELLAGQSRVPLDAGATPLSQTTTTITPDGQRLQPALRDPRATLPIGAEQFIPENVPSTLRPAQPPVTDATATALPEPLPAPPRILPNTQPATAVPPAAMPSSPSVRGAPPLPSGGRAAPNAPTYADGSQHPLQGGLPRTPGGAFNAGDDGYDHRQQVHVPGGASAGPFETSAAPSPSSAHSIYGGGAPWNHDGRQSGGGGGGSLARDMYWRIRNTMEAKVGGMGPGGSSAGSYGSSTQDYRQQQRKYTQRGRRIDRAYDRFNDLVANPPPQEATGWAKHHLGKNKGNYSALLDNPMPVATKGMGFDPQGHEGGFQFLSDVPVADLAMITGGTERGAMLRKTQAIRPPKVLKKYADVDPVKPDRKRELDYSDYAKQVADLYQGLSSPSGNVLDFRALMGQLASAHKKGALRQGIEAQAEFDPGGAFDRARGYFDSVIRATKPDFQQTVYEHLLDRYMAEAGGRLLNKKPKAIDAIVQDVARRFV